MNPRHLTLEQIKEMQNEKLRLLVVTAGSRKHLAFMLDVPLHTVNSWVERGRISKAGAALVEKHETLGKKFPANELRPDLKINQ